MRLTAVVLTLNEERHLGRCIESLRGLDAAVLVADCYSADRTLEIAREHGARVVQRQWVNYATQFNWALAQLDADTDWVLRIDADEVLTPELVAEIRAQAPALGPEIDGVYVGRRMTFQRRLIRHGGVFPVQVLRLFRYGRGQCENRWMDEHIKVAGPTVRFAGELIDDNLQSLTWWTQKHNRYASREAVDLLNLEHGFMPQDTVARLHGGGQAGLKRWVKELVYARLPGGLRAFAYFFYRYVLRLGFLDGAEGTAFHVLQGFWYRYLVDAKVREVRRYMALHQCGVVEAIEQVLEIRGVSQMAGRGADGSEAGIG
ncbi:glycosyl transferase [Thiohalocapsa halophila]|uniref:Glycosyl transferase n=1 Tax=Thiohalocapsa halophila TaxID=69359 RepID=A0ABS1CN22_9GAMM|nr:glycosyltransferase family 2 protein [Thiohalocapsa halophila]MBK1633332.1 glycosyl transferase [Thiohalocapsa halophila]